MDFLRRHLALSPDQASRRSLLLLRTFELIEDRVQLWVWMFKLPLHYCTLRTGKFGGGEASGYRLHRLYIGPSVLGPKRHQLIDQYFVQSIKPTTDLVCP